MPGRWGFLVMTVNPNWHSSGNTQFEALKRLAPVYEADLRKAIDDRYAFREIVGRTYSDKRIDAVAMRRLVLNLFGIELATKVSKREAKQRLIRSKHERTRA
jgi:hypothetical protein